MVLTKGRKPFKRKYISLRGRSMRVRYERSSDKFSSDNSTATTSHNVPLADNPTVPVQAGMQTSFGVGNKEFEAASKSLHARSSHPTVTSPMAMSKVDPLIEVKTPETLNQVVEEFVAYEIKKIRALGQIQDDLMAEELMARGATVDEIKEASHKERKDDMANADI